MKSYKVRAIEAAWKLIEKYESATEPLSMGQSNCSMCKIFYTTPGCSSCPLRSKDLEVGCVDFKSYPISRGQVQYCFYSIQQAMNSYKRRIKFWKKVIPILEQIPARRFTPSGWSYFEELDRRW